MTFPEAWLISSISLSVLFIVVVIMVDLVKKIRQSPTDRAFAKLMKEIEQMETIPGGPTLGCGDTCCDCTEF